MPFAILFFLFIFIPIAEISLLINVSGSIGGWNTILVILITAALGAYLVRQQGFATLTKLQTQSAQGKLPAMEIAEGVALLFAGAVLLTPGFITDAIGFALLTPPIRRGLIKRLVEKGTIKMQANMNSTMNSTMHSSNPNQSSSNSGEGKIIEGELVDKD